MTEAKNQLSALIDGLRGGDAVLILDRGVPVARLEPVAMGDLDEEGEILAKLVRDGIVRPRERPMEKAWIRDLPTEATNAGLTRALLEERRKGR